MNYRETFYRITLIAWSTIAVIIMMCSITLNTTEAYSLFIPAVHYDAGGPSNSVAIGDLNGDSHLDLVTDGVWVLLGNGDGTFQAAVHYDTTGGAVAIGDLNVDGHLDLVTEDVSVLLGNGDGTFQSAVHYDAGDWTTSLAIGDLNGDANPDLAVANDGIPLGGNVGVLLGNGDGSFQSVVNYHLGTGGPYHESVAIGDLNGDANPDLAVGTLSAVSVLFGNGDGSFQSASYYAGNSSYSVAIGDLNGDANPDLAVAGGSDVYILINTGGYGDELAIDFGTLGLWNVDTAGTWRQVSGGDVETMAGWANGLAMDFGSSGLWNVDTAGTWTPISGANCQSMSGLAN